MIGYFGIRGAAMFGVLAMLHSLLAQMPPYAMLSIGWFVVLIDALIVSVAIIQFLMCYLLYSGKSWGRYVIIGLTGYTIINSILNILAYGGSSFVPIIGAMIILSAVFIILDSGVMYAMFRPETKAYFRKKKPESDSASKGAI